MSSMELLKKIGEARQIQKNRQNSAVSNAYSQAMKNSSSSLGDAQYSDAFDQAYKNPGQEIMIDDHAPGVLDQWRSQIDEMIKSGNPALQEQGLGLLKAQHKQNISDDYLLALNEGFTGSREDWSRSNQPRNYAEERTKPGMRFEDEHGNTVHVPAGMLMSDVYARGLYYKDPSNKNAGITAMTAVAKDQIGSIRNNLVSESGEIDQDVVKAVSAISNFGVVGKGALAFLDSMGITDDIKEKAGHVYAAFDIITKAITRTETGAAMAKDEVSQTEKRFVPSFADSPKVQMQKLVAMELFIDTADALLSNTGDVIRPDGTISADDTKAILDNAFNISMAKAAEKISKEKNGEEWDSTMGPSKGTYWKPENINGN